MKNSRMNWVLLLNEKGALISKWWWSLGKKKGSLEEKLAGKMFGEGLESGY